MNLITNWLCLLDSIIKERLTIVIFDADMEFLKEHRLKWQTADGQPIETDAPATSDILTTPVPGEGDAAPTPTGTGTQGTPAPTSSILPTASPESGGAGTSQGDKATNAGKEKKNFVSKKIKCHVTVNNQVGVQGASNKKLTKLIIPDTVTYQGRLYKVTSIKKESIL